MPGRKTREGYEILPEGEYVTGIGHNLAMQGRFEPLVGTGSLRNNIMIAEK